MKLKDSLLVLSSALALSCTSVTSEAALTNGTLLSINPGIDQTNPVPGKGSYFSCECAPGFFIGTGIMAGPDGGIILGSIQNASGSHQGAPDGSESPGIDMPWEFFSNTGLHLTTAPITLVNDFGATKALDFRGWAREWNEIFSPLGGGNANFPDDTGIATIRCDTNACNNGENYVLDYTTHFPDDDPSGFGRVQYDLHLEGTIIQPPSVPQLSGTWKSSVNDVVFLFGENLSNISEVLINGVNLTHLIQPMGTDNRALLVLADGLKAPYTVKMTTAGGTVVFPESCTP